MSVDKLKRQVYTHSTPSPTPAVAPQESDPRHVNLGHKLAKQFVEGQQNM